MQGLIVVRGRSEVPSRVRIDVLVAPADLTPYGACRLSRFVETE
jgi:hypothetical protein